MVEFVVRVPEQTPPEWNLYVAGDGPVLGDWSADRVQLDRGADGAHRGTLDLPAGSCARFLVTPGRWRAAENDGHGRECLPRALDSATRDSIEISVAGWGRNSLRYHHGFPSRFVDLPRTVSVWLPPGYDLEPERRFPVLYLNDGQNLFDPETAFAGNPWWADEIAEREIRARRVHPLILVGIANTADRLQEYGPRQPGPEQEQGRSREYGRFVVEEVKPFIDTTYRTLPGPEHTGIGGSSMGGLIALHLCQWYPGVFGQCAALSPSLWWDREHFLRTVNEHTEWLERCRLWVDMGTREGETEAGMRAMARRIHRMAAAVAEIGPRDLRRFHFEEIENGTHGETAWNARLDRVLRFLYGVDRGPDTP